MKFPIKKIGIVIGALGVVLLITNDFNLLIPEEKVAYFITLGMIFIGIIIQLIYYLKSKIISS